jgi:hypothetical protein
MVKEKSEWARPQVQQGTMGMGLADKELQAQLQPQWGQEQMFNWNAGAERHMSFSW